ncbi:unnamed protein product [Hymenolepis diminuta]|uniref:Uncharacterized protein n=1 Tax=Hymenolepis diminuta TaxID=6216 RepID=A0A564Z5H7_HYMDI|nr:unnamed protein product [Hymenolepis diminuta]
MFVLRPKRSTVVDDKCKPPQKINLAKSVLTPNVVALNIGEAELHYRQDLKCSLTKTLWFQTDLSFAGPIQRTSYLIRQSWCTNSFCV